MKNTNIWERYNEMGGGKAFQRKNSSAISAKETELAEKRWGYDQILDYEKERKAYYEELVEKMKEPLKSLEETKELLQKQIMEAENLGKEIQPYTDKKSGVEKAFKNKPKFNTFVDKTAGSKVVDTGKKAEKLLEKTEDVQKNSLNQQKAAAEEIKKLEQGQKEK